MKKMHSFFVAIFGLMMLGNLSGATEPAATKNWLVPAGENRTLLKDSGQGAERRLILENGFLRAFINPGTGGRIESLIHKRTGRELTMPLTETVPGGLLSDHLWQQDYWRGDWLRAEYTVKVQANSSEKVSVNLSAPARLWKGLSVTKVITIHASSSVLDIQYSFSASDAVNAKCKPDFVFHQALAGTGKFFLPTESGVRVCPLGAEREDWVLDPACGWMGFVGDDGTGLGMVFDFSKVRAFRVSQTPSMTMETLLRKIHAQAGTEFNTTIKLTPFAGLNEVAAVGENLAVDLTVGKSEVKITLAPFTDISGKVTLAIRPLAGEKQSFHLAGSRQFTAKADTPVEIVIPFDPKTGENFVLEGLIQAPGQKDLRFEKPVFQQGGKGVYCMAPEVQRTPEVSDTPTKKRYHPVDLNFNSTSIPTPHREWAKDYAGGRPRMLALMKDGSEREAVEFAQRFAVDLTCAFVTKNVNNVLGDKPFSLRQEEVNENLDQIVDRNFDVIVLNTIEVWPLLTPKAIDRIIAMHKNGTGLVLIQRGETPEKLKDLMPIEFEGYDKASGLYTLTKDAPPILNALPYEALPVSFATNGGKLRKDAAGAPLGQVLLRAVLKGQDRGPLVAVRQTGKGRLVQTFTEGALIPPHSKFIGYNPGQKNDPMPAFDYWEYHYAMFARLIYWAAGKDFPVTLLNIAGRENGEVTMNLEPHVDGPAKLRVTIRDWFGQVLAEKDQPIDLKKGAPQTVTVPFEKLSGRPYLADVIVGNQRGTLAFGAGIFPRGAVRFAKVAPEKPVYQAGESAILTATFEGTPPSGALVRGEIWDYQGRKVAETVAPAVAETKLTLPLNGVIGVIYQGRVSLVTDGKILDQYHCEGGIKAIRHPERYRSFFWDSSILGSEPLYRTYYQFLRSMGFNAGFASSGQDAEKRQYFLRRADMPFTAASGVSMYTNAGVTKQDAAKKTVESACVIHNPKTIPTYRERVGKNGEKYKDDDVLIYTCADENKGPPKGVCYCEDSKLAIRKQLQELYYPSIVELNKEWGTSFKSFDEVLAMTEEEVKEHAKSGKSYAPWIDHLNLVNWGTAQLARNVREGIEATDPAAIVGESGTQEPAVYNSGRDWWWMSKAYSGLAAYGGLQTTEQESYNPAMIRYFWCGYGKPNPFTRDGYYNALGNFNRGFATFSSRLHIDPDFTLSECGRELRGVMSELGRGIGQLLVSAETLKSPVFILQSHSSLLGTYILGQHDTASVSRRAAVELLPELGMRFQSLSPEQLAGGLLNKSGARLLLLPCEIALSPEEIKSVREWVRQGGVVVADLMTAQMTDHGRLYAKPELDDVFGIDRSASTLLSMNPKTPAEKIWRAGQAECMGAAAVAIRMVEKCSVGSAKPLWKARVDDIEMPIVFRNSFGKGFAYYLSADLLRAYKAASDTPENPDSPTQLRELFRLFEIICTDAGVKPEVTLRLRDPKSGLPTNDHCPWVWPKMKKSGNTRYLILLRDYETTSVAMEDVPVAATLAAPGAIYDVIAGRFLGFGDTINLTMVNCTSRIFAILPSEVSSVDVRPSKSAYTPGEMAVLECEVKTADGKTDSRVLRVEVRQPDGRLSDAYTTDLICPDGKGVFKAAFAFNDPKGDWRVKVIDITTGLSTNNKLTLK
jgi:hypothetical protein